MPDSNTLPIDVKQLQLLLIGQRELVARQNLDLQTQRRQIEHLKLQLAKLRRFRFGQSSEQMQGIEQMVLSLEALVASAAVATTSPLPTAAAEKEQPVRRKHLPEHFERIDNTIEPNECTCPGCGGPLGLLGSDSAEILDVKTVTFTVTRHIRPKRRCSSCSIIVQAAAPARPIEKSFAGASLLALILSWKYAFHLPLYRQCQIFAHAGLTISRTTLMQWVAGSSELLGPLVAALAKHVLAAPNINADDTPIKVLAPGSGKTKKGRLWTYVRDGTGWGSTDPPAVWYRYSPSWHGKYPQKHLANFIGKLQVDAYAGFEALFVANKPGEAARIIEIACFAHLRRKFFDLFEALSSPIAQEALERIGRLYVIEKAIRGRSAEERQAQRQQHAVPILIELHAWMIERSLQFDKGSAFAAAFNYAFNNWDALQRYTQDGHLEIDNNIAERSVRGAGVGRKNYLFFGSDSGGERAAIIYSLVETCKLNRIDPQRYLHYVLERIAAHPINRIEELLPWNLTGQLRQPAQVTHALAA
ncbi:MAG: IS66 family transposase [Terriglobia bacterium]|nr:IS66 family transposase [Terriglobia bacterium]